MAFTITTPVNIDSLTRINTAAALSWTRVTTTITVTHTAHGLVTNDVIYVNTSSDTGAVPLGAKTVTVLNANSYTFTGVNTGAASGTITITATDVFNINGGYLTVDQDSRYGTNAGTATIMGNIVLSATLGGTVEFNAQNVRLIPYDGGSGNVPASNTTISGSTGSGKLIGVYSALNVAPTAAGSPMPATGFIKIKQWNSVAFTDNDTLSGLTATVNGTDSPGWIEVVGMDAMACTVNRLNTFKVRGEWYNFLGTTTTGTRSDTYQLPTNGSSTFYCPGVWVETSVGSNTYEFYPCAGNLTALVSVIATDSIRGKYCWITTSGVLRFGHDGTNSSGGYIPPAGLKIRVPNIFFVCATQAAPTVNVVPNTTLATRYDFNTAGGGVIDIDKCFMNWYPIFSQPFSVSLTNFSVMSQISLSECASAIAWSNLGIGQPIGVSNSQNGLVLSSCFAGGTISDSNFNVVAQASTFYPLVVTDSTGYTFSNVKMLSLTKAASASAGSMSITRFNNTVFNNSTFGAGRAFLTTCSNVTFNDTVYYDHPATTTTNAIGMYAFDIGTNSSNITMDGLDFGGLTLVQPYLGILNVAAAGCSNIKLRNLGTYNSPLNLGGSLEKNVSWTRSTTVATVTKVAHGLKVNDIIYVVVSDSVAAITVAAKTVASVPTADTFTFTCLNAGNASGTLTYYPQMSASLFVVAAGAAANSVYIERCYAIYNRGALFTIDNSSKNIWIQNVFADYITGVTYASLNTYFKNVGANLSFTAQTSCYGTHWVPMHFRPVTGTQNNVSWSRTTTTATITCADHNLVTGNTINVFSTSDSAAIILGAKTITATTTNAFTFTCLNAGGTSGTISFKPLTSRLAIMMNESTSETVNQYTIDSGTPSFTSAGSLYMPTVNQQVTFETPYYILGFNEFPIAEAVMAGGTLSNYNVYYSINYGSGYSSFKNLYYQRTGGGGSNGSTNITMTDTTGVSVGDYIFGTNVGPNAKVTSITNSTTVVVDVANTGTVSGILRFNHLPSETIPDLSVGFKLKVRIVTLNTNATAITSLYVFTNSNDTSRAYEYPIDLVTITLTGLKNPTEIRVFNAGTTTEIADTGGENVTSGSHSFQVPAGTSVDISILSLGYQNTRLLNYTASTTTSIPISQVIDRQYANI